VNVNGWRGQAGVLALVIGLYLAGSWIPMPRVAVGDVVTMCEQPYMGWHIWRDCPDRIPQTTELAGAGIGLIAVAGVVWITARRIARALGRRDAKPSASE
jgi:hypothetical protein